MSGLSEEDRSKKEQHRADRRHRPQQVEYAETIHRVPRASQRVHDTEATSPVLKMKSAKLEDMFGSHS